MISLMNKAWSDDNCSIPISSSILLFNADQDSQYSLESELSVFKMSLMTSSEDRNKKSSNVCLRCSSLMVMKATEGLG